MFALLRVDFRTIAAAFDPQLADMALLAATPVDTIARKSRRFNVINAPPGKFRSAAGTSL
jgi:hypothetical protein